MTKKEVKIILDLIKEAECSMDEYAALEERLYCNNGDIDDIHEAHLGLCCSCAEKNILITILNRLGADTEYKHSIFR